MSPPMNLNTTIATNDLLDAQSMLKNESIRKPNTSSLRRPSTSDKNPQNIGVITMPGRKNFGLIYLCE